MAHSRNPSKNNYTTHTMGPKAACVTKCDYKARRLRAQRLFYVADFLSPIYQCFIAIICFSLLDKVISSKSKASLPQSYDMMTDQCMCLATETAVMWRPLFRQVQSKTT